MRALIQRVRSANLLVSGQPYSQIEKGLLILVGIEEADTEEDALWLSQKILKLRIFNDENGVMNLSAQDIHAQLMVVSQFTLHAKTKKGSRPSYIKAAKPDQAVPLYEAFIASLNNEVEIPVATGVFGADMDIELVNSGPVTIWIDTKNKE